MTDIPSSMDCSIDNTGNVLIFRAAPGQGEIARKRLSNADQACGNLQARVASGECFVSGNIDPCAGRTGANGPRLPHPDVDASSSSSSSGAGTRPNASGR